MRRPHRAPDAVGAELDPPHAWVWVEARLDGFLAARDEVQVATRTEPAQGEIAQVHGAGFDAPTAGAQQLPAQLDQACHRRPNEHVEGFAAFDRPLPSQLE